MHRPLPGTPGWLLSACVLTACATMPEVTTQEAWLARQLDTWNAIRDCNPELAMCHQRRQRWTPVGGCFPPEYPREARKSRQEGRTTVRIDVEPDGRVSAVVLLQGSGHASLDHAATQGFSACRFPPDLTARTASGSRFVLEYQWELRASPTGAYIRRLPG